VTDTQTSQSTVSPSVAEIDASCRLPLFVMFVSAAIWLLIGSAFGFISTLKFHNPNFLADSAWLTYGRTHPAAQNSFLYGFCLQAGLGVGLWVIARLGRTLVAHRWMVTIGAQLWNLGVTVGVLGILAGDGTGFENLDMPLYGARIVFLGYLLFGIWAVLTFHQRRERVLFVSQWFILAALFWFPWIYTTAYLLLVGFPVRGVAQAVIAWWFSNNLSVVLLWLIGLAAVFYFVPRLAQTELQSRYLALLTFWTLILFGPWCGIPNSAPVPAWMPALSTSATLWMLIPLLAAAVSVILTLRGKRASLVSSVPLQFIWLGMVGFLIAGLMNIAAVLPPLSQVLQFTWFTAARAQANSYGFFSLVMFGAIYYIVPKLSGIEFTSPKLVRLHLRVAAAGLMLIIVPLAVGGLVQGLNLQDPAVDFLKISRTTLTFLRASTMGDVLLAAGHLLFAVNVIGVVRSFSRARVTAAYATATASLFKPAGAP
jgi:cytochrome c oxidase cbb3-type subunit 1